MVYPKDPHPRDPHKKSYLKFVGSRKQSETVPVKKYSDQSFTPNDSLYVRVVQKIQADAKDKTQSPFYPRNVRDSRRQAFGSTGLNYTQKRDTTLGPFSVKVLEKPGNTCDRFTQLMATNTNLSQTRQASPVKHSLSQDNEEPPSPVPSKLLVSDLASPKISFLAVSPDRKAAQD